MARSEFGGVMASWLVTTADGGTAFPEGTTVVTLPLNATALQIYDAPDGGGTLVTDFLDVNGLPVTEITVPAGSPYIPRFQGPDLVTSLYVQASTGDWVPIPHYNPDGLGTGGGGGTGDVVLAGGNVQEYADSQGTAWLTVRVPDDGTPSSGWADRLVFEFFDNSTGVYRRGFYLNEKNLLRVRGTTPNDVPGRIMAHPDHDPGTAVFEVANDDTTDDITYVRFYTTQVVYEVPIVVPYFVNPLGERLYWGTADPATDPAYADYRPDVGAGWVDFNDA